MIKQLEIIDAPNLVEVASFLIEDCRGNYGYRRVSHFEWQGADFWVLGTMVWRNTLQSGRVRLRLPKGRKLLSSALTAHSDGPPRFTIHRPRHRHCESAPAFVFEGFCDRLVVNIDFVKEEHRRWDEFHKKFWGVVPEIEKPPSGTVV